MGEEINIEKIEVMKNDDGYFYQIDFRFEESGKMERSFIRKDALFALLCVAEKEFMTT